MQTHGEYFMKKQFAFVLGLFSITSSASAVDLTNDVMIPIGRSVAYITRYKDDAAKAADVLAQSRNLVGYAELGLTLEPSTQAYRALIAAVGQANAHRKYVGLMDVLRTATLELQAKAQAVPVGAACGADCGALVDEMRSIEELGHSLFTDVSRD